MKILNRFVLTCIILSLSFLISSHAFSDEGFQAIEEPNVVMLKGKTNGETGFVFNDPTLGRVLITRLQAIRGRKMPLTLQWGYEISPIFRLKRIQPKAFRLKYNAEILWSDRKLDLAVLKMPKQLLSLCQCKGFEPGVFSEGLASLIGYPVLERRIWPHKSPFIRIWRELWAHVQQKVSYGRVWQLNKEYLSDLDVLSGGLGGPILQDGKVIGVIYHLKIWKHEGYKYKNPSFNFIPIQDITQVLKKNYAK